MVDEVDALRFDAAYRLLRGVGFRTLLQARRRRPWNVWHADTFVRWRLWRDVHVSSPAHDHDPPLLQRSEEAPKVSCGRLASC